MIYIYLRVNTRLGNWMFQYAAAMSLGTDEIKFYSTDAKVIDLYSRYRDEIFHGTELVTSIPSGLPVYEEQGFAYQPIIRPSNGDFVLSGFFQSPKYFDADRVRAYFYPCKIRIDEIYERFDGWLNRPNVTGISVRRTDYMQHAHIHPFCGRQYYRDCFARIPDANDFIVCSDDIAWCKSWFPKEFPGKNFLFVENAGVLNQLYVHAFCKNVILSNSSFCWWAGWLNRIPGHRVFAPSMWFGYACRRQGVDWQDIYFAGEEVVANRYTWDLYLRGFLAETLFVLKKYAVKIRRKVIGR